MDFSACPDAFEIYYTPACGGTATSASVAQTALAAPQITGWHMVPLSPTATGLVLILLTVLFTTLLVSKTEK